MQPNFGYKSDMANNIYLQQNVTCLNAYKHHALPLRTSLFSYIVIGPGCYLFKKDPNLFDLYLTNSNRLLYLIIAKNNWHISYLFYHQNMQWKNTSFKIIGWLPCYS